MPSEGAKRVNKFEDDDEKSIGSMLQNRKKKLNTSTSNGSKVKKEDSKVKKEENNDDFKEPIAKTSSKKVKKEEPKVKKEEAEEEFEVPVIKKNSNNTDKKKKKIEEVKKSGAKGAEQNGKKTERVKKVYDLPGQKRDPPEERDPLRIFYETLYDQVPESEMAAFWMMESGLLPKEEAKKVYEKKLKKNQQRKLGSPMKAVVTVKKSAESVIVKRKTLPSPVSAPKKTPVSNGTSKPSKKRKSEDGSDDDFELADKRSKKQRAA